MPDPAVPGEHRKWWCAAACLVTLIPIAGLFTTSRIFFVRDLSFFFWPRHLWLRQTIFAGDAPWWNPFVAGGQSAIADALNQLLMPATLAIRLLPSAIVSFNLWVAIPLPLAAAGMWLFLARRLSPAASTLGAIAFALSGPIVSMLNTPNLAWSVACLPWAAWAADRAAARRTPSSIGVLAIVFALQALSGEPVTGAATAVVILVMIPIDARRPRAVAAVAAGILFGAGLAAAQLWPTLRAGVAAHRGLLATPDFWSLHPIAAWEVLAPNLFGNYYDAFLADLPWMGPLNFGRDPFFYSLYLGPFVVTLAAAALVARRRRSWTWGAAGLIALILACGGYTPAYPALRRLVPALTYFRFPVKYLVVTMFAAGVLVGEGWDGIAADSRALRKFGLTLVGLGSIAAAALVLLGYIGHGAILTAITTRAAAAARLPDIKTGAAFLARVGPPLALRTAALFAAAGGLVAAAVASPRKRAALAILFAALTLDLAVTTAGLNPTIDLARVTPPPWYQALGGARDRLYVGGRVRGFMNAADRDAVKTWQIPADDTAIAGRMALNAELPMEPSGWSVREALSYDLPALWPGGYEAAVTRFERADAASRDAFLRRSGVRWCVLPAAQPHAWRRVADVSDWNMRVYECHPDATRALLAPPANAPVNGATFDWQIDALFDAASPDNGVRLDRVMAPAGTPGPPAASAIDWLRDQPSTVVLRARTPMAAILVLRDSFADGWRADVDGQPADIARANGLYRAVALAPGTHVIRFFYRPTDLLAGLTGSGVTALLLAGWIAGKSQRTRRGTAGFTLLELMIVLAILGILAAVAFTSYRGMEARGNEASALSSIRTIATAQWEFAVTCGNGHYATTLVALGQPSPATNEAFLSPDLAAADPVEKSGYSIHLAAKPIDDTPPACNAASVADGYTATADPLKPGTTGSKYFGVNADRVMYVDTEKSFKDTLDEHGAPNHGEEVK